MAILKNKIIVSQAIDFSNLTTTENPMLIFFSTGRVSFTISQGS